MNVGDEALDSLEGEGGGKVAAEAANILPLYHRQITVIHVEDLDGIEAEGAHDFCPDEGDGPTEEEDERAKSSR